MALSLSALGERLELLRVAKGVSKVHIAQTLDISDNTYRGIEKGYNLPSVPLLVALADYFDVSLDYLCGRDKYLV